jgi:hypothetical protein
MPEMQEQMVRQVMREHRAVPALAEVVVRGEEETLQPLRVVARPGGPVEVVLAPELRAVPVTLILLAPEIRATPVVQVIPEVQEPFQVYSVLIFVAELLVREVMRVRAEQVEQVELPERVEQGVTQEARGCRGLPGEVRDPE